MRMIRGRKTEHSQVIGSALDAAVLCDIAERTERRRGVGNRLGALGTLVGLFVVRHGGERHWVGWEKRSGGGEGMVCLSIVEVQSTNATCGALVRQ